MAANINSDFQKTKQKNMTNKYPYKSKIATKFTMASGKQFKMVTKETKLLENHSKSKTINKLISYDSDRLTKLKMTT